MEKSYPIAKGGFIQGWLAQSWSDAQWQSEMNYMKELGMDYIILQSTINTKNNVATYATQLPGYKRASGNIDMIDSCLRNAEKKGLKVFIELNWNDDWWKYYSSNPQWLYNEMEKGNTVAEEIYRLYHKKYPNAFYGWYWWWEIDNLNHKSATQQATLAKAIDISFSYLHKLTPEMPVMLCPFMNPKCGPPEEYQQLWTYVFAHSSLGNGTYDIFCPQDGLGGGMLTTDTFTTWFTAFAKAIKTKPGLKFWSDSETFRKDGTSATLDRFVKQMQNLVPYVDKIITFSYTHYYSPNVVGTSGFHKTYLQYVKTGELEKIPPGIPPNVKADLLASSEIQLTWSPATDDIGVCGYNLYRNGERISYLQLPKELKYVDTELNPATKYTYQITAYDFAGNISLKSNPVTVTTPATSQFLPHNIALGCSYTLTPTVNSNYPDRTGHGLTDGKYGDPKNIMDTAWQGWNQGIHELLLDLKSANNVQQVVAQCLYNPGPGISLPESISVAISTDGKQYTKIGNINIPKPVNIDDVRVYKLQLRLIQPSKARYVKLTVDTGYHWVFIDEIEVRY